MEEFKKFMIFIGAIAIVYIVQTLFKVSTSYQKGDFDWKKLIDGLVEHSIYFIGIILLFTVGLMLPEIKYSINGEETTLMNMLFSIIQILLVRQAIEAVKNIIERYNIKNEEISQLENIENFRGE